MKTIPNDQLTARPRILFKAAYPNGDLIREVFRMEPRSLKEFTPAYMTPGTREHKVMESETTKKDRDLLVAFRLLQRAQAHVKSPIAAKELVEAAKLLIPDYSLPDYPLADLERREKSAWLYPALLNQQIQSTHGKSKTTLFMWRAKRSEQFVPAILCADLKTAAFAFAAYRGVEVCLGCRCLFAPDPDKPQKYHSIACGQRVWQKDYRLREKKKLNKRKGRP